VIMPKVSSKKGSSELLPVEISGSFFPYTVKLPSHTAVKFGSDSRFTAFHYQKAISRTEASEYQAQLSNDSIDGCPLKELSIEGVPIASVRVSCNDEKNEYYLHYFGNVYDISGRAVRNDYDSAMWLSIDDQGLALTPVDDQLVLVGETLSEQ
jgi:hypothetical protein